jgi:HAD superfamily hydrolase (TIGR01509 family)
MRHKALLLDLDGTLVRTDPLHRSLWADILSSFGIHITPEEYEQRIAGKNDTAIWQEWGVGTPEEREAWTAWKQEAFLRRIHEAEPVSGGRERIQEWAEAGLGHWVGVVTNSNMETANALLVHLGVAHLLDVLITSDYGCAPKPSPEPYQAALRELGVDPENAVIVEDSPVGMESASRVGAKALFRMVPDDHPLSLIGEFMPIHDFTDNRLSPSMF